MVVNRVGGLVLLCSQNVSYFLSSNGQVLKISCSGLTNENRGCFNVISLEFCHEFVVLADSNIWLSGSGSAHDTHSFSKTFTKSLNGWIVEICTAGAFKTSWGDSQASIRLTTLWRNSFESRDMVTSALIKTEWNFTADIFTFYIIGNHLTHFNSMTSRTSNPSTTFKYIGFGRDDVMDNNDKWRQTSWKTNIKNKQTNMFKKIYLKELNSLK